MDRYHGAGETPPQQGFARAGHAGAPLMVKSRWRLNRLAIFIGLAALWTAGMVFSPSRVIARPYDPTTILEDTSGTGDPTGDDRPSPTPKPTSLRSPSIGGESSFTKGGISLQRHGSMKELARWMTILRISLRLGLR